MPTDSTLILDVDLANPGQFLACCGLFELASRLNPDAQARFAGNTFEVSGCSADVLDRFVACTVEAIDDAPGAAAAPDDGDRKPDRSPRVLLGPPFNLRLDWWHDDAATAAGFKTWAAGMTVLGFFNGTTTGRGNRQKRAPGMREHLARNLSAGRALLQHAEAIDRPSPFNFDSRVSRNTALDLGFVGDITLVFSPAVELLAMVGLQRFRPRMEVRWDRNTYHAWREPLPVTIAAAVAHGLVPSLCSQSYAFAVKPRDAQGRYKAFGPAILERSCNA